VRGFCDLRSTAQNILQITEGKKAQTLSLLKRGQRLELISQFVTLPRSAPAFDAFVAALAVEAPFASLVAERRESANATPEYKRRSDFVDVDTVDLPFFLLFGFGIKKSRAIPIGR
jgi:hypothetical protein